ncbi:MAG: SdrD B-like domain-containing protein, partial [Candidatus Altarchaeaceae archaeon]
ESYEVRQKNLKVTINGTTESGEIYYYEGFTNENGELTLSIPYGNYTITSYYNTTNNTILNSSGNIKINSANDIWEIYMGFKESTYYGAIQGIVFDDVNMNGIKDEDEDVLANVSVSFNAPDGSGGTVLTDANGRFVFYPVEPGIYNVSIDMNSIHKVNKTNTTPIVIQVIVEDHGTQANIPFGVDPTVQYSPGEGSSFYAISKSYKLAGNESSYSNKIENSTISDDSSISDSNVSDSAINSSTIENSHISNSTIINITSQNSTIINSIITDSTIINSNISNSTAIGLISQNSNITNSTLSQDIVVMNATIDDNVMTSGTIIVNGNNITVNNSGTYVNGQKINNQTSFNISSIVIESNTNNSSIIHSIVAYSNVSNSTIINSAIESSNITNS